MIQGTSVDNRGHEVTSVQERIGKRLEFVKDTSLIIRVETRHAKLFIVTMIASSATNTMAQMALRDGCDMGQTLGFVKSNQHGTKQTFLLKSLGGDRWGWFVRRAIEPAWRDDVKPLEIAKVCGESIGRQSKTHGFEHETNDTHAPHETQKNHEGAGKTTWMRRGARLLFGQGNRYKTVSRSTGFK